MDSKDRDESRIRRREETLARRVGEALDRMNPHGAGECPDAEIIAAYAEQALGPAESGRWEGHFATCARCRKILRVLVASADTPLAEKEVAQLGQLVSTVRGPVETSGSSAGRARPRLADWRLRWLAPALGAAAVLAVWFMMRPPWRVPGRGASETLVAQAPKEESPQSPAPAELDRLSKVAPQQDRKTQAVPLADQSSANMQSLNSPVGGLGKERASAGNAPDRISPSAGEVTNSLKQEKKLNAQLSEREIQPPATPPPPPLPKAQVATGALAAPQSEAEAKLGTAAPEPVPQVRARAKEAASPTPEAPPSTSQSVTVTESIPQVGTTNGIVGGNIEQDNSKDRPLNGRDFQSLLNLRPAPEILVLLKAPSGSVLWRAGKGGIIQRSTDAGKTWASEKSPSKEDWLAGAAVSDKVCWLVGRNGAIARTTDGKKWKTVISPPLTAGASGKLPDWVSVTANGAKAATITGGDQRRYSTNDGGRTWEAQ